MRVVEASTATLVHLALRLDPRHRLELLREYPSLSAWVRSRRELPGSAWAFLVDGVPMFVFGVVSCGSQGWLWLAGALGWQRYVKHVARLLNAFVTSGAYVSYVADAFADNAAARRFIERGGFELAGKRGDRLYYRRFA